MRTTSVPAALDTAAARRRSSRQRGLAALLVVGAFLLQVAGSSPASAASGDLTLASTSDTGVKGDWGAGDHAPLSGDGWTVAFESAATNLGEGDTDMVQDLYVKDLRTGALTLASTSDLGVKGNSSSFGIAVSTDGSTVAFYTYSTNLGEGDTSPDCDAYVKDLVSGALTLATPGNITTQCSIDPLALSSDGSKVAYYDSAFDIFVKDLATGTLTLVSSSDTGVEGNAGSFLPSLSADGSTVAFLTSSTNLGEGDTSNDDDIYVKDLTTGSLTLASTSATGAKGNGGVNGIAQLELSAAGTHVAFSTRSTDFDEGDTDTAFDLYVKDLTTGALTLASTSDTGSKGDANSIVRSVSADGSRVAFVSPSTNFGEGDTDTDLDIYVKDLTTGALTLASSSDAGVKGNDDNFGGSLSADGSKVSFMSQATNLGEGDTDSRLDVYVKELPGSSTPGSVADAYATSVGTTLTVPAPGVLANDGDPDPGDSLRASLVTGPSHGTVALAVDGSFTYTPATGDVGPDSFTYRASDGSNSTAPATVTITVNPANTAPVAFAGDDQTVAHDVDFTLSGSGTDGDGDDLAHTWTQVSGPEAVIRDPDAAETVVEGVQGKATLVFRHTVTDPSGASSSDDVTVTVNPK